MRLSRVSKAARRARIGLGLINAQPGPWALRQASPGGARSRTTGPQWGLAYPIPSNPEEGYPLVPGAQRVTEGTISENTPDLLEPRLGTREQMSPHRDFRGSQAIGTHHSNTHRMQPDAAGSRRDQMAGLGGRPSGHAVP
ncbi:hypothetical protein NDU88_000584 [Pleurodeles waltl]|uniref:Uncharacterized protein n=1 Tax=Pleurodeles waltl TaxID=8319 RepID=A0AAV7S7E3_PLEWA|nr:hypothetical protein NDU88_000584 [Pleurodeles waltl]